MKWYRQGDTHKECSKCKELKPLSSQYFTKNSRDRSGFYSSCKTCVNAKHKRHRVQQPTDPDLKVCTMCLETKQVTEFYTAKHLSSGRIPRCKSCTNGINIVRHQIRRQKAVKACITCDIQLPLIHFTHPSGKTAYKNCSQCREKANKEECERTLEREALKNKTTKICPDCKIDKPKTAEFYWRPNPNKKSTVYCKICAGKRRTDRENSRKEKTGKSRYMRSKEAGLVKPRTYVDRAKRREYKKRKMLENPVYRLIKNLSRSLSQTLKTKGSKKESQLSKVLGCSTEEFKKYIESKFEPGMSWENYGKGADKWNVDHHYPQSKAATAEEVLKLNHYTNLQPMWEPENMAKGNKVPIMD